MRLNVAVFSLLLGGCAASPHVVDAQAQSVGSGIASYYGGGEYLSAHTANGERFNANDMTAAHRSLPFGTRLRVTTASGGICVVRVNDRGPAAYTGRIIDLSRGAARQCGFISQGTVHVRLEKLN